MKTRRFAEISSFARDGKVKGCVVVGKGLMDAYEEFLDVDRTSAGSMDEFFVAYDGLLKQLKISRREFIHWALIFSLMDDDFDD